jgi:hypothetical protein
MFFQEITPDTSGYMIAGYAVTFLVLGIYVASLYLRSRNLRQDIAMLEQLEELAQATSKKPAKAVTKKSKKK